MIHFRQWRNTPMGSESRSSSPPTAGHSSIIIESSSAADEQCSLPTAKLSNSSTHEYESPSKSSRELNPRESKDGESNINLDTNHQESNRRDLTESYDHSTREVLYPKYSDLSSPERNEIYQVVRFGSISNDLRSNESLYHHQESKLAVDWPFRCSVFFRSNEPGAT